MSHRAPWTALTLLIALLALAATVPPRAAASPALGWQYAPMGVASMWSPPAGAVGPAGASR